MGVRQDNKATLLKVTPTSITELNMLPLEMCVFYLFKLTEIRNFQKRLNFQNKIKEIELDKDNCK